MALAAGVQPMCRGASIRHGATPRPPPSWDDWRSLGGAWRPLVGGGELRTEIDQAFEHLATRPQRVLDPDPSPGFSAGKTQKSQSTGGEGSKFGLAPRQGRQGDCPDPGPVNWLRAGRLHLHIGPAVWDTEAVRPPRRRKWAVAVLGTFPVYENRRAGPRRSVNPERIHARTVERNTWIQSTEDARAACRPAPQAS